MSTAVFHLDPNNPDPDRIAYAADLLRRGKLVAFPTETVYGLGANALDATAVRRIFAAKGRPATNPLIVHVTGIEQAHTLAADWPPQAQALAEAFWPGSLTLVVPRRAIVPDEVTAGGPTVALRVPAHPVALALLQAVAIPIAAPSANRSNQLSPTRAEHVLASLGAEVALILDGGPAPGGLESTVVDVTISPPRLLRPGLVTLAQLEAVVGPIAVRAGQSSTTAQPLRSPGQLARHYAPRTFLELAEGTGAERVGELLAEGRRVGWLTLAGTTGPSAAELVRLDLPCDAAGFSAGLYAALHELDAAGIDRIVVSQPPPGEDWLAVHDRLRRAATSE